MPPPNNFPGPSGVVSGQPGQALRSTSGGEDRFAALPPDLRPESGTKELPPRSRRTRVGREGFTWAETEKVSRKYFFSSF